jgi:hypothetical protein
MNEPVKWPQRAQVFAKNWGVVLPAYGSVVKGAFRVTPDGK